MWCVLSDADKKTLFEQRLWDGRIPSRRPVCREVKILSLRVLQREIRERKTRLRTLSHSNSHNECYRIVLSLVSRLMLSGARLSLAYRDVCQKNCRSARRGRKSILKLVSLWFVSIRILPLCSQETRCGLNAKWTISMYTISTISIVLWSERCERITSP